MFLSYYILFCYVLLLSIRSLFISNDSKKVNPDGREDGEELGGRDGEKCNQDTLYEK